MATLRFAQHWSADRRRLEGLCAGDPSELHELSFGAGDSHRGGATVTIVRGESWSVVYKPRSLAIDRTLRDFVAELGDDHGSRLNVRIPEVIDCSDYGWVEFVSHRFAAGNEELLNFYRGIGHLLALMRLLSGSDLHAENMIAHGGTPVVVECRSPSKMPSLTSRSRTGVTCARFEGPKATPAWCHGAVGIGLAHLDLDPTLTQTSTRKLVRRAAAATWRLGVGWNHCVCHGDLGAWELLDHAIAAGEAPKELSTSYLLDIILTSLEQHGPSCGMGRNAFSPGLLPGLAGIAYQLLRAHPEHDLPSILTPSGADL